ncbi:hypothetical protein BsWGS_21299 [Bradybaena similaris]
MSTRRDSYKSHWTNLVLLMCAAVLVDAGPNPFGGPQFRQRQNLANGICNRPLAISVCLESCMAENPREFGQMGLFVSSLVKYLTNVQPNTIKMAINYCSSIQQWVDWTPSTQMFADYVMGMHQLYALNMNNAFGAFGPFGTYGAFSPLQPAAGVCLERARLAMAQLPPSYQPLVILLTSGRSSNPMYTIQQAQAAMFAGAEIFAVTEREPEMSEELKLSVSGPNYLMAVNDMIFLGRPEIDAIITSVCQIERAVKSPLFPVHVVGDLQKPKDLVNIPLLLAQGSDQTTPTSVSSRNTTASKINVTSSDIRLSMSDTTELDNSSTVPSLRNSSSSESEGKDTLRQQFSTPGSEIVWQNVTGKTTTLPVSNFLLETLPINAVSMESFQFGVTQSGASVSTVSDKTTSEPFGSEATGSSSFDPVANQFVTPESENKSFTTPEIEITTFNSNKPNSTFAFEGTTFELLESKNSSLRALEFGNNSASLLQSDNTTFGLLPLIADSGEVLLEKTTQSVHSTPRNIGSEMFNDNNRTTQKISGVFQTNVTFSDIFSTATLPSEASSIVNPSSPSITDESRFEEERFVTFPSAKFLRILPTVNTRPAMLQLGVIPTNNSPTKNVSGNTMQKHNAFPEQRLPFNALNHNISDKENETAGEPPLEFMRDGCAELEGTSDPLLRARMQQERPECSENKTAPHATPDESCIDLSNITNPLVQLDIILANTQRQPCGDNSTNDSFTSPTSPEEAPQLNISDSASGRSKSLFSAAQETRICIDLNNIFDIYKLGVMLANWPNQFVDDNNVSNQLKPAHAESISALGVNGLGKQVSFKQLGVSDQPKPQPFLQTSETPDTTSTTPTPASSPALTTNFTTTTDNSVLAIKDLASNNSLLNMSSRITSESASPTTDLVKHALSTPHQPFIKISITEDSLIPQALLSANTTIQPSAESDSRTPMTNSSTNIILQGLNSNNLKHNDAAVSLPPKPAPRMSTTNVRTGTSLETSVVTIKPSFASVTPANVNVTVTNLSCIDISSAPPNTRRVLTELIKPLTPCPLDAGLDENTLVSPPITSAEPEMHNSCPDLAMLPPFIKLIVKIFPILSPCEKHDHIKIRKREIIFHTGKNKSSASKFVGNIDTASETPSDYRQAGTTTEVPCVEISILPERDRPLAADFFRLYNILSCDSQKSAYPTADQMEIPDSCVNVTMFSGNERTRITTYFSLYGIRPCLETRNCLDFTLLTPELLSKHIEIYGPIALCNNKR